MIERKRKSSQEKKKFSNLPKQEHQIETMQFDTKRKPRGSLTTKSDLAVLKLIVNLDLVTY